MLTTDRDQILLERLNRHPLLRTRMESLLTVVEDAEGDCERADAAERRVIDERCRMGNDALTAGGTWGGEECIQPRHGPHTAWRKASVV